MHCPHCNAELYIDFRSGKYVLWRCKLCPYMEVTEEPYDISSINSVEAYKGVKGSDN